ncbi:TonB-dependent receptor [Rhizorhabdus wittichii]|jgi:outer membrane receptor protein involved in Fe transport|uniref:TonB-dependent receptor n=1 Tax=Rhizorhabdus wittichii TaxID=160791 RepID=A0A975D1J8_9SPHN|nr:TonB-dependent receptor [Rhizorhabdus wittichii]QTH20944.1 TonB-dependent receptor [Rhizorhabdus wittichii]
MRQKNLRETFLAGAAIAALLASPAMAQDAPAGEGAPSGDIVVTGTRVVRDGYLAPTPTTVVGVAEIQKSAQVQLADYINQLPQLSNSLSPTTNRNGSSSGASFLNLRGLGVNRTLVLLDGRRVTPSSLTGNVDFALLPQALVQRVDIVTGGASSAWGSDAVAGVVNLVLDREFKGLKGEIVSGISDHGDGGQFKANLSFGTPFADGRGHFIASVEHNELKDVPRAGSRDWYKGWNIVNNPAYVAGGSAPMRLLVPNVGLSRSTPGGLISAGPLAGTQFLAGGEPARFNPGSVSGLLSYGGDGYLAGQDQQLLTPVNWDTVYARAEYEVSPAFTLFADGNYAKADSSYSVRLYQRDGNITISRQNAYLDPVTAARMDAAGLTSFQLGKLHTDLPVAKVKSSRELIRGVVGATGDLGGSWSYDAYYQYGRTLFDTAAVNNVITANYNNAVDAVDQGLIQTGVANGNIVCRSSLTSPGNGCVPFDVFGTGGVSQAAQDYIFGEATQSTVIKQQVAAANLRGEPFSLWAGPVSVALGVEWRKEQYNARQPDPISLTNGFFLGNYKPSAGSFNVREGYFEAVVPLLVDLPFAKRVEFDGAVRYTDYSTSGSIATWKAGLSWEVDDQLRLRGTISRDIRAPNLNELFLASASTNFAIVDPVAGGNYSVRRVVAGNRNLGPERAITKSAGIVYRPNWFPGFSASVDVYDIKIDDAIFTPDAQVVIDQCQAGVQALCAAISRGAGNLVTEIRVLPQNVLSERARGLDIDASYRRPLGEGQLSIRALASHVFKREVDSFGTFLRYDGVTGDGLGLPKWRAQTTVTYDRGGFSTTLTSRYVSGGVLNKAWGPADIDDNSTASRTYFDLSASYTFSRTHGTEMQIFGVVQNLFDKDPAVSVATSGNAFTSTGTNASFFDTIGRQFRVGVRFRR